MEELEDKIYQKLINQNKERIRAKKAFWTSTGILTFMVIIYFLEF